ncbi:MAG: hypothetical protein H6594_06965 [Flavobacteriales bacterium]|nr:hypothetical protein [Flavobacteriales bacterium]
MRDRSTWWVCAMSALIGMLWMDACKHGRCEGGGTSSIGSTHSHNAGRDCMTCHHPDGEGEGCWTIAGTVYLPDHQQILPDHRLLLFTRPLGQGDLTRSIDGDANGNVYTSDAITFGHGLFPAIVSGTDTAFMDEPIKDGACNRCHGVSTARISVP